MRGDRPYRWFHRESGISIHCDKLDGSEIEIRVIGPVDGETRIARWPFALAANGKLEFEVSWVPDQIVVCLNGRQIDVRTTTEHD